MVFYVKGRRHRYVDRVCRICTTVSCLSFSCIFFTPICQADLVVLADFNTTAQSSEMATAEDFTELGVEGLAGTEQVLSISGRDSTNFSSATYIDSSQAGGVFQFQNQNNAFLSSWRSASSASFRTFSLSDQQEQERQETSMDDKDDAGAAVIRDFIHLTRNSQPGNQSRRIRLSNLGLSASKSYELYLFGNLGMGRNQDDEFWTESQFQGLSTQNVTYDSDEIYSGSFRVGFTTSDEFVDGEDSLDFLWELNENAEFGTFNGFAITETVAVPEPNSFVLLAAATGMVLAMRHRIIV